jgi:hypothetical protein
VKKLAIYPVWIHNPTMAKTALISCALSLACLVGGASAGTRPAAEAETALRQSMQEALWPADIVRLSGDYLRQYPRGDWADAARALYERANDSVAILGRSEVRLYKSAFQPLVGRGEFSADIRKAALGDQDAAVRLAHVYRDADRSSHEATRYVGWLQYAAMLGSDDAAYELALYFRKGDQPALASQYEARAVALGYVLPTALDHSRK